LVGVKNTLYDSVSKYTNLSINMSEKKAPEKLQSKADENVRINVRVSKAESIKIHAYCKKQNTTVSNVVREFLFSKIK